MSIAMRCHAWRASLAGAACLAALVLSGCATNTKTPPRNSPSAISGLNLLGLPVAINLDDRPGADGIVLRLFATSQASPRAVPLRSGILEILAYEGTPNPAAWPEPFHCWTFTPAELIPCEFNTLLGTGYKFVLNWLPRVFHSNRVTVIARYRTPAGNPVTSAPSSITTSAY